MLVQIFPLLLLKSGNALASYAPNKAGMHNKQRWERQCVHILLIECGVYYTPTKVANKSGHSFEFAWEQRMYYMFIRTYCL